MKKRIILSVLAFAAVSLSLYLPVYKFVISVGGGGTEMERAIFSVLLGFLVAVTVWLYSGPKKAKP